jgi:hypothetical protein
MSSNAERRRAPTFNHIAVSVPADALDAAGRDAILRFHSEVFGWTEMPTLTADRERLVMRAYSNEQFVYLVADPDPMICAKLDHFGMSVGTPEELYEMLDRARSFQQRDDGVEIVEPQVEDFQVLKLHNFYVRYRLPLMVEVQCFDWAEGVGPDSLPAG